MSFQLIVDKKTLLCKMPGVDHDKIKFVKESKRHGLVVTSHSGGTWFNNGGGHYAKAHWSIYFCLSRKESATHMTYEVRSCVGDVAWDKRDPAKPEWGI